MNGIPAQLSINVSIAMAVLGPALHVQSASRELDAVNTYNDAKRASELSRPDARASIRESGTGAPSVMTWSPRRIGLAGLTETLKLSPRDITPGVP